MRHLLANAAAIFDGHDKENEREHLRTLWMLADFVPICFVSIDLEGPSEAITELGLASQRKNQPRSGRHFVVHSTRNTKTKPPGLLVPPTDIPIFDTATIFKTFIKGPYYPSLVKALRMLGYNDLQSAPVHNAANDAWYALELLFLEAEQALKQITSPDGEDTIDWLAAPNPPPNSPSRGTSTKRDYDRNLSTPTLRAEKKSKQFTQSSSPYHSQTPHTLSNGRANPTSRRHRSRKRARSEDAENDDSTQMAALAEISPPAKRQKVTHECETTDKAEEGAHGGRAVVGGQRGEPNEQGKDGNEGSEGGPVLVTSGAS